MAVATLREYCLKYFNICYCIVLHYYLSFITFIYESTKGVKYYKHVGLFAEKNAIIIGGTSGIGYEVAKELCQLGLKVIIAGNNEIEGFQAQERLEIYCLKNNDSQVIYLYLDLCDPDSIVKFVNTVKTYWNTVDILINNAGVMVIPFLNPQMEEDTNINKKCFGLGNKSSFAKYPNLPTKVDINFAINFLGPTLLTYLLLPTLMKPILNSGIEHKMCNSRIVNTSSVLHQNGDSDMDNLDGRKYYSGHGFYARSKLALTAWTFILSAKLCQHDIPFLCTNRMNLCSHRNVTVNCCHPGVVYTNLYQYFSIITLLIVKFVNNLGLLRTPTQASQTILYLALSPDIENVTGKYFENCRQSSPSARSRDKKFQNLAWDISQRFSGPYLSISGGDK